MEIDDDPRQSVSADTDMADAGFVYVPRQARSNSAPSIRMRNTKQNQFSQELRRSSCAGMDEPTGGDSSSHLAE